MINFVSSLPCNLRSGGFSAMNVAAYQAILQVEPVHYVGPINPPPSLWRKVVSKAQRGVGTQGDFFFFAQDRLHAIAAEVHKRSAAEACIDFFHGFTPWILTEPGRPYMAWSDCAFHDYIDIYHKRDQFRGADLERIETQEALWLGNAIAVGFSSTWAAQRTIMRYGLDPSRVRTLGAFGEFDMPDVDQYQGLRQFLFVSTDFEAKGGPLVLDAFIEVHRRFPDASLVVVGAPPKKNVDVSGVSFAGYLRKENPGEASRFREILTGARALVHPTLRDVSPLIIVEAGYFGCPAISMRKFAIPHLIEDGRSGVLLDEGAGVAELAEAMNWIIENDAEYRKMRKQAWSRTRQQHSRKAFEKRVYDMIAGVQALTP